MYCNRITWLLLIAAASIASVRAHVKGAPQTACITMTPKHHGIKAQKDGSAPYNLTVSAASTDEAQSVASAKAGEVLSFRICGRTPADTIRGFLVEVRHADNATDTEALGKFLVPPSDDSMHTLNCGHEQSSVTHSNALAKPVQCRNFTWQVPAGVLGPVHYVATIAREFGVFWVAVPSPTFVIGA